MKSMVKAAGLIVVLFLILFGCSTALPPWITDVNLYYLDDNGEVLYFKGISSGLEDDTNALVIAKVDAFRSMNNYMGVLIDKVFEEAERINSSEIEDDTKERVTTLANSNVQGVIISDQLCYKQSDTWNGGVLVSRSRCSIVDAILTSFTEVRRYISNRLLLNQLEVIDRTLVERIVYGFELLHQSMDTYEYPLIVYEGQPVNLGLFDLDPEDDRYYRKEWDALMGDWQSDVAHHIIQTRDRGYIIAGYSYSDYIYPDKGYNSGWADYFIVKIDETGSTQWTAMYGGFENDIARQIIQTDDGGYLVIGSSLSNMGPTYGYYNGYWDIYILKLSAEGDKQWDAMYGGYGEDYARSVVQTTDGGYILAGTTGSYNINPTYNNGDGWKDYYVIKLNSGGMKEWDATFGGWDIEYARCIIETKDGGYILTGSTRSQLNTTYGSHQGNFDIYTIKLNRNGTKAWDSLIGGNYKEHAYSITQTADLGYIIAAKSQSRSISPVHGHHYGGYDMYLVKLSQSGTKEWDALYGGSYDDVAYSIVQTDDSGYIVAGGSRSSNLSPVFGQPAGNMDFYVLKLNAEGALVWDAVYGGNQFDEAYSIIPALGKGYMVIGTSKSNIMATIGAYAGSFDYYIVRLKD